MRWDTAMIAGDLWALFATVALATVQLTGIALIAVDLFVRRPPRP
jgi:hypothetical protein